MVKKNLFIHIHVPKTAGTSFNEVLKKNFGEDYEEFSGRFIHHYPEFTENQWLSFLKKHPGIRAVSSHNFNIDIPFFFEKKNIVAIAFLRDPVERFISFYFHMKHRPNVDCIEKKMDLTSYIDLKTKSGTQLLNSQLKSLTGNSRYDVKDVRNLVKENKLMLCDTNKFKESLFYLNQVYPNDFQMIDNIVANRSKKTEKIEDSALEILKASVNPIDYELLNLTVI